MTQIFFASNRNVLHETSVKGALLGPGFNAGGPQCFRVGRVEVASVRPAGLTQCTRRLHVLAHSMGNWALRHAAIRKFIDLRGGKLARICGRRSTAMRRKTGRDG